VRGREGVGFIGNGIRVVGVVERFFFGGKIGRGTSYIDVSPVVIVVVGGGVVGVVVGVVVVVVGRYWRRWKIVGE